MVNESYWLREMICALILELDQFDAVVHSSYKLFGTTIWALAFIPLNAFILANAGTDVWLEKSYNIQLQQLKNTAAAMLVTLSGIVTFSSETQSRNAESPMPVQFLPMTIWLKPDMPDIAFYPISPTQLSRASEISFACDAYLT